LYMFAVCLSYVFVLHFMRNKYIMSAMFWWNFQHQSDIFAATTGGAETMASEMAVQFLGRVPLDPRIGLSRVNL